MPTENQPAAAPTTEAAPKPIVLRKVACGTGGFRILTGTKKSGADKGKPVFHFSLTGDDSGKNMLKPTWAQLTDLAVTLGVADTLAQVIDREILRPLATEVSGKVVETGADGKPSINVTLIRDNVVSILAEETAAKVGKAELQDAAIAANQQAFQAFSAVMELVSKGANPQSDEYKTAVNRANQLQLKATEANAKLEAAKRRKANAAAATAAK